MLILPQVVINKWNPKNKKYYESKGYKFTKFGEQFEVNVLDLTSSYNNKIRVICDFCNKEYQSFFKGNIEYCCKSCIKLKAKQTNLKKYGIENPMHRKEIKEKIKQTNLEKYGVEYNLQRKEIRKKIKQTNLEKYGVECSCQREDIKERIKQTNLEKYGVEYSCQREDIKERIKQTNLKKYGVRCSWQRDDVKNKIKIKVKQTVLKKYGVDNIGKCNYVKEKIKQTNLKKYGVENPLCSEEIKQKMKQTNLKKYGVEFVLQSEEIQNKIRISMYENGTAPCSKQQKYLYNLLGGELNYPVGKCSLDIAFPNKNLYIEYDGSGHGLNIKLNRISKEEFKQNEINRFYYLKSKGWKLIKYITSKDILLEDDKIKKIIQECKEYLLNTNHTWIEINIDENKIKCQEYEKNI